MLKDLFCGWWRESGAANNDKINVSHLLLCARLWAKQSAALFQQLTNQPEDEDEVFFFWGRGDEEEAGEMGGGSVAVQGEGMAFV